MMRRLPVLFFCLLPGALFAQNVYKSIDTSYYSPDTVQQRDLIDIFRSIYKVKPRPDTGQKKGKIYFSFLPVATGVQGPGRALITSTTAGFYLGEKANTSLSSISFTPYFNFKGRYGVPIRSNIWLNNDSWNIQGDTRFMVYPTYTWGLISNQPESNSFLLNYKYARFYQSALKRITSYFFAGIGYDFDSYIDLDITSPNDNAFRRYTGYKYGTTAEETAFSSGPTVNLLYDTRNNSLNPMPGVYANVIYRFSSVPLGSNNNWQSLYIDLRKYVSITNYGPKNILAFWSYYWTSLTPGTPYLDLPSIGMDPYQRSGRGIEQSRYRGQRLFYFESEFRRDITRNGLLGFVVFANVNSTSEINTNRFAYWHPAGGTGLRIKFNKRSNTNVCIDYAFSKNYQAGLINLGEAF
jgi:Omp85 superfamily domain